MALRLRDMPPGIRAAAIAAGCKPDDKRQKYGAVRTTVGEVTYDSFKEAGKVEQLKVLERAGVISDLVTQPVFPLVVTDVRTGLPVTIAEYRADAAFTVVDPRRSPVPGLSAGARVVIDVKSEATAQNRAYRLKKKLVAALCGVDVVEI